MQNATVLFHVTTETPDEAIRAAASAAVGERLHLGVMLHMAMPALPMNAYGAMPYSGPVVPDHWATEVQERKDIIRARVDAIEALLASENASGDVRACLTALTDVQAQVAQSARTADMSVLAPDLRDVPDIRREIIHGILFQSPIGLLFNAEVGLNPQSIMIAWDDSPASARAAHLALPMLKTARDVTIACFDPNPLSNGQPYEPGAALSNWLSHHGCNVTVAQYPTGGAEVAESLTARATELGSDLIVMGGYSHSRVRQARFGGTTRSMIEQSEKAVFMAH